MTLRPVLRPPLRRAVRSARDPSRTPASGGPLSPVLENILGWYAFGDAGGSGGLVDAWADSSGNGLHATEAGGSKPTLLANGAVSFTPSKKLTVADAGTVAQPLTFALRMKASGDALQRFFGAQDGCAVYVNNGTFRIYAGTDVNSGVPFTADEWVSVIVVVNGANSAVYTADGSATGLNAGTLGLGRNAGFSFNDPSFYGGATWQCAEALVYVGALDAVPANVTKTLAYLDSINPA